MTKLSRKHNRDHIYARSRGQNLSVGNHVKYKATERMTFTAHFDPHWLITRVRGPVVWIVNQETGKRKTINKEKVVLVDPEISWDQINQRPVWKTCSNQLVERNIRELINRQQNQNLQSEQDGAVETQHEPLEENNES